MLALLDTSNISETLFTTITMDPESPSPASKSLPSNGATDDLVSAVSPDHEQSRDADLDNESTKQPPRRLYIYPRSHILKLHESPMVKPPEGMPALKYWFG